MSTPKFHHFVPQMISRRFTTKDGIIYFFDKTTPEKGTRVTTPRNLMGETHLYSTLSEEGKRDASLETKFSELESRTAPILDEIEHCLAENRAPKLTTPARSTLLEFFFAQWRRVPEFHNKIVSQVAVANTITESLAEYEKLIRPLTEDERVRFNDALTIKRMRQNTLVDILHREGGVSFDVLEARRMIFAKPKNPKSSFVLGSFPVIKLTQPESSSLAYALTEVWLAVSPHVALCSYGGAADRFMPITSEWVRRLNLDVAGQSRFIAGRSEALIRSLSNART